MGKNLVVRSGEDRRQSDRRQNDRRQSGRRESDTLPRWIADVEDGPRFVRGVWSDQSESVVDCYDSRVYASMHPRARRLAIAFAVAVDAGMPRLTALRILTEWAEAVLRRQAADAGNGQLTRAVWVARLIMQGASKGRLDEAISSILAGEAPKCALDELASCVATEAWNVDASESEDASDADDAAFMAWYGAAYLLGAVERTLPRQEADDVFVECSRTLAAIYQW